VHCELCGAPLLPTILILFEISKRQLYCCCRACGAAVRQSAERALSTGAARRAFSGRLSHERRAGDALAIPIDMAFFFHDSSAQRIVSCFRSIFRSAASFRQVEALGHTVTPVIWAGAGASAHVTSQAYEQIAGEIVEAVKTVAFDAIYLDLHGAMVAEHIDDGEGELLKRVRALVGQDMKIAVSVDSHANMTAEVFALANVIRSLQDLPAPSIWRTPGDARPRWLLHVVDTKAVVHFAVARLPVLIPVTPCPR